MGSFPEKLIRLSQEQKLGTRGLQVLPEHIPVPSIIILRPYNDSFCNFCLTKFSPLDPVVQMVDSAIHRLNLYPLDNVIGFPDTYPLDSDLSCRSCSKVGYRYPLDKSQSTG